MEWGIRNGNERNNFIYTSPPLLPCKQDLPAGNEMRGNLNHAKNGRGIKFSLPILSPGKKKQSYILRGRTPPIYGGAPSGFCENSIFLSHLLSPRSRLSDPSALPSVTGRRERTIFVSFKRDKNIVTRSQSVFSQSQPIVIDFFLKSLHLILPLLDSCCCPLENTILMDRFNLGRLYERNEIVNWKDIRI